MSQGRHLCSLSPSRLSKQPLYSCFSEKPSRRNSFSQSRVSRHCFSWCEHGKQVDVCMKGAFFWQLQLSFKFLQSHSLGQLEALSQLQHSVKSFIHRSVTTGWNVLEHAVFTGHGLELFVQGSTRHLTCLDASGACQFHWILFRIVCQKLLITLIVSLIVWCIWYLVLCLSTFITVGEL